MKDELDIDERLRNREEYRNTDEIRALREETERDQRLLLRTFRILGGLTLLIILTVLLFGCADPMAFEGHVYLKPDAGCPIIVDEDNVLVCGGLGQEPCELEDGSVCCVQGLNVNGICEEE